MTGTPIYLDYNATTPIHPRVVEAMLPYLRKHFGNPSSGHPYGRRAHEAVEAARAQVAALLGSAPEEVLFTSGGTEANNLAIRGVIEALSRTRRHVVTSTVEHPATARPCAYLEEHGAEVTRVPVDASGQVRIEELRPFVRGDTALVTIMLAQNETGTLMPLRAIAEVAHARGALVHTDAAQAVGKVPLRVDDLGVDLLSVAGHKLYAPKGIGALYVRGGTSLRPLLLGAGHERGLRPGTENVPCIVGLGEACALASEDVATEAARVRALRDELWERLRAAIPGLRLNGNARDRLPNTLNVSFPGVRGSAVLAAAPAIAASTGSACHEGGESPSAMLVAMGLDPEVALGAVRLSLGRNTTSDQITEAARALVRAYQTVAKEEDR
jgi:cysteine desulfurase